MIESLPEAGHGRSIDLGSAKTVGQRGRHARISNEARTVVRVETRMMQGRAKKERKPMTEEPVCVGVDVAKDTLEVAVDDSSETRQFENNPKGIARTVRYLTALKPSRIILATGRSEKEALGTVRISMGRGNTTQSVEELGQAILKTLQS